MVYFAGDAYAEQILASAEADPFYGCVISTLLRAAGNRLDLARVWAAVGGSRRTAGILDLRGEWFVCGAEPGAAEETAEFLRFMGCGRVWCRAETARALPGFRVERSGPVMRLRDGVIPRMDPRVRRVREGLRGVYAMVNPGASGGYDEWLSMRRLKERVEPCGVFALYADGALAATASVGAVCARYGVVDSVATLPAFRGRGFASGLARHLCALLLDTGRIPLLGCETPLEPFYRGLGFADFGRWALASPRGG